uniref:Uncharacterized protein n=1 Tax=Neolamprologus brichardi TaxID=32507 RepID=A0A3Q4HFS2_NEOBR
MYKSIVGIKLTVKYVQKMGQCTESVEPQEFHYHSVIYSPSVNEPSDTKHAPRLDYKEAQEAHILIREGFLLHTNGLQREVLQSYFVWNIIKRSKRLHQQAAPHQSVLLCTELDSTVIRS